MTSRSRKAIALVLCALFAVSALAAPTALAAPQVFSSATSTAPTAATSKPKRAPERKTAAAAPAASTATPTSDSEGSSSGVRGSSSNWLAENGLVSMLCKSPKAVLDEKLRINCQRSGLASMPSPTANLGFDVHVDTGITKPGAYFASTAHNIANMIWGIFVTVTAALFAALEWAFSLNLLDNSSLGSIAGQLREIERTWTEPMLRVAAGVAGAWIVYQGLMMRRARLVAGELVTSFFLVVCVMMIVANPIGTVGAVNKASNDLALYAISAVPSTTSSAASRTSRPQSAYGQQLNAMFNVVGTRSWALLEFGNVSWATNPKKFDSELQSVASKLAESWPKPVQQAVADADTNGELFLAFPPNTAERDGINDLDGKKTLLGALCDSDDIKKCKGKYKPLADQRTEAGTMDRWGQLALVTTGLIAVWVILGSLAIGLIGAAAASVFYLFLVVVTAPLAMLMVGDTQRRFRKHLVDLGGALFAKLIFAIALSLVMLVFQAIIALKLPFFPQWLLMVAAFGTLFKKRKELLAIAPTLFVPGRLGQRAISKSRQARRSSLQYLRNNVGRKDSDVSRLADVATRESKKRRKDAAKKKKEAVADARDATRVPTSTLAKVAADPAATVARTARARAIGRGAEAKQVLEHAKERHGRLAQQMHASSEKLKELQPGSRAHEKERRRRISLERRMQSADAARTTARQAINHGREVAGRPVDLPLDTARAQTFMRDQAAIPAPQRNYEKLAAMASVTPEAYRQLEPRQRNQLRSQINRELKTDWSTSTPAAPSAIGEFATQSTGGAPRKAATNWSLSRARVAGAKRERPAPRDRSRA